MTLFNKFIIFTLGLLIFSLSYGQSKDRWVFLPNSDFSYDKLSITKNNNTIKVWVKTVVDSDVKNQILSQKLMSKEIVDQIYTEKNGVILNCSNKTYAFFSVNLFNRNGTPVSQLNIPNNELVFNSVSPDSNIEDLLLFLCKKYK